MLSDRKNMNDWDENLDWEIVVRYFMCQTSSAEQGKTSKVPNSPRESFGSANTGNRNFSTTSER